MDGDELILEQLRSNFPGWYFGRTHDREGRPNWWTAKRNKPLTRHQEWKNLARTLYGDNPAELREELEREQTREVQVAASEPLQSGGAYNPAHL